MKRILILLPLALWPALALAQQPQFTVVEQRLAICTIETVRLQQQLTEALQKVAALEKAAKPPEAQPDGKK